MIKGLIFDADGTLIDSMGYWMSLPSKFLERKGKKSCTSLDELEKRIFSMTLEQGAELLKKEAGLCDSAEEIKAELVSMIEEYYKKDIPLKAGAKDFLETMHAKNIPMAVATSGSGELVEAALERLGCLHYFTRILSCGQLGTDKSRPDIYEALALGFNAAPEEIVVFEDTLVPVQTAAKAGFRVIAISDEASRKDEAEIRKYAHLFAEDFNSVKIEL